jgi:AraC-like DNA-binding protein
LHPSVRRALDLLGDGAWDQDLARLAKRCGVSEAYLSRIFKRQVGVALSRYRNSARLGRFLELRRASGGVRTLTDLAFEAGFGSYAQFYKVYQAAYGQGPGMLARSKRSAVAAGGDANAAKAGGSLKATRIKPG